MGTGALLTMIDALQYGAMGLLTLVLGGVFTLARQSFGRQATQTEALVADVLKIRESMVGMSERLFDVGHDLHALREATEGLRRDFVRAGIRLTPEPPAPREEPIQVESVRRPRTDPTGRRR